MYLKEKYPNIIRNKKEVMSDAKKLKKLIHKSTSAIDKEVDKFMNGYVDIVLPYYIDNFYRGRIWNKDSYPMHIDELLCPPKNLIKDYGRLNTPNHQVLYLSESVQPIYKEIRAQDNDEIILLRIIPRLKSSTLKVSSLIIDNCSYNPLQLNPIKETLIKAVGYGEQYHSSIELRKQVGNILSINTANSHINIYKLTSAIGKNIFSNNSDGVLYSSIQTNKIFTNFATRPEIMNTHLQGHTVVKVKLNKWDKLSHNVTVIKNGIVKDDGTLLWDDSTTFEFPKGKIEKM